MYKQNIYTKKPAKAFKMPKTLVVTVVFVLFMTAGSAPVWSQNASGELFSVGIPLFLSYQFPFEEIPNADDVGDEILNNLRFNLNAQLLFNFSPAFSLGFETGLSFGFPDQSYRKALEATINKKDASPYFNLDVPLRAVIGLTVDRVLIDIYSGFLFQDVDSVTDLSDYAIDLGVRLGLVTGNGSFIVDVGYIVPGETVHPDKRSALFDYWSNSLRIGVGYRFGR